METICKECKKILSQCECSKIIVAMLDRFKPKRDSFEDMIKSKAEKAKEGL